MCGELMCNGAVLMFVNEVLGGWLMYEDFMTG
jgi:hypothetical protein